MSSPTQADASQRRNDHLTLEQVIEKYGKGKPKDLPPAIRTHRRPALGDTDVEDKKNLAKIRARFRTFLSNNLETIEDEMIWLLKNATKDDAPRVTLLNKIIDKLVPEMKDKEEQQGPRVAIQINGVERGARLVRMGEEQPALPAPEQPEQQDA